MTLHTVRWQETWGDQLQGVLDGAYTESEIPRVLGGYAGDWFPDGFTLTPDGDSPGSWSAAALDGRRVWFFVEPVGGSR
jgi:hypothetical protein